MADRLKDYCPQLREDEVERARFEATPQYAGLPVAIRHSFTGHEWAWMSDARRALLIQHETEPEWNE